MFMWVSTKRGQYFDRIFNFRNLCSIPFTFYIIYGRFVTPVLHQSYSYSRLCSAYVVLISKEKN